MIVLLDPCTFWEQFIPELPFDYSLKDRSLDSGNLPMTSLSDSSKMTWPFKFANNPIIKTKVLEEVVYSLAHLVSRNSSLLPSLPGDQTAYFLPSLPGDQLHRSITVLKKRKARR